MSEDITSRSDFEVSLDELKDLSLTLSYTLHSMIPLHRLLTPVGHFEISYTTSQPVTRFGE